MTGDRPTTDGEVRVRAAHDPTEPIGTPQNTAGENTAVENTAVENTAVEIVDVAPRDGLQSDPASLTASEKVELIGAIVGAGIRRVEVVSFVNPRRVPQMADADEVLRALPRESGASFIGLVLNARGLDRALSACERGEGVDEVNVVVVCTDSFARANQGATTRELVDTAVALSRRARSAGLPVTVTLAASFGCPYEGEVPTRRLVDVASAVLDGDPNELALADSIGVAVPRDVEERITAVRDLGAAAALRCHFHNTRNTGIANALAAVEAGVRVVDASVGGIGGCPFAPNATGNIATEDVVYALERSGFRTGVDLGRLVGGIDALEALLGHPTPGLVAKAGLFPANVNDAAP